MMTAKHVPRPIVTFLIHISTFIIQVITTNLVPRLQWGSGLLILGDLRICISGSEISKISDFFGFSKIGTPRSRGIAPGVPEMDPPWNSTYSRAQELLLTPPEPKVTRIFVKFPPNATQILTEITIGFQWEQVRRPSIFFVRGVNKSESRKATSRVFHKKS